MIHTELRSDWTAGGGCPYINLPRGCPPVNSPSQILIHRSSCLDHRVECSFHARQIPRCGYAPAYRLRTSWRLAGASAVVGISQAEVALGHSKRPAAVWGKFDIKEPEQQANKIGEVGYAGL